jgi:hypothetical protein
MRKHGRDVWLGLSLPVMEKKAGVRVGRLSRRGGR